MEIVPSEAGGGALRDLFNTIWLALFGSRIAVGHLVSAVVLGSTIIGTFGFARQHLKLLPLALFPFGRELRQSSLIAPLGDCSSDRSRPVVDPAEHLVCAHDPAHPAGGAALAGRCPQVG
jgi:hypothetical protein